MKILKDNDRLVGRIITGFDKDAVRLMGNKVTVNNVTIIDSQNNDEAHRDAFQLIPASQAIPNQQYAAATIDSPTITNCSVYSKGALQGVFCSDGLITDAVIEGNAFNTHSAHRITLNGVLSGRIKHNTYGDGSPLLPTLNNLRIGGGIANVWINSFRNLAYEAIEGDVNDNRGNPVMRGTHLDDFDLDLFLERKLEIKYVDVKHYCSDLGALALQCGRRVK